MTTSTLQKTRRRDAKLENAIIDVAWAELLKRGYAGLTMESVAAGACTSRTVLARRWNGKATLAGAAVRRQLARQPLEITDHGDIRAELLEYLDRLGKLSEIIATTYSLLSDSSFLDSYPSSKDLRKALITEGTDNLAVILRRAAERGEINSAKLIPPVESLLRDLIAHHILINGKAPSEALRITWVDSLFLPLVASP